MYKKHKLIITIIFIASLMIVNFPILNLTNLTLGIIVVNILLFNVYTLSLSRLIGNQKLCKRLANEQDNKLLEKSKLGVITGYYRYGYIVSMFSIVIIYISSMLNNVKMLDNLSFSLLNINFCIAYWVINFMLNYQLRKFEL